MDIKKQTHITYTRRWVTRNIIKQQVCAKKHTRTADIAGTHKHRTARACAHKHKHMVLLCRPKPLRTLWQPPSRRQRIMHNNKQKHVNYRKTDTGDKKISARVVCAKEPADAHQISFEHTSTDHQKLIVPTPSTSGHERQEAPNT